MKIKNLNRVCHSDATKFIKSIPNNSIDLVLTDPPYGVSATSWDKEFPLNWYKEVSRIMKSNASLLVFCGKQNRFEVETALRKSGLHFWQELVWYYRNGGLKRKTAYCGHHEPILWFVKNKDDFHFDMGNSKWIDCWTVIENSRPQINFKKDKKIHPTQKSLDVVKRLIKYHSKTGDIVLDPFIGSGTTAVACKELGRNFLGCDINREYVKMAKNRLKSIIPVKTLDNMFIVKAKHHKKLVARPNLGFDSAI